MKISETKNIAVKKAMPIGRFECTFERADWVLKDGSDDDIRGMNVFTEEYTPLYIPVFDERNTQLEFFLNNIGASTYDLDEINSKSGAKFSVQRYEQWNAARGQVFTNNNFGPRDIEVTEVNF